MKISFLKNIVMRIEEERKTPEGRRRQENRISLTLLTIGLILGTFGLMLVYIKSL